MQTAFPHRHSSLTANVAKQRLAFGGGGSKPTVDSFLANILNDDTPDTFSRQAAATQNIVPKTTASPPPISPHSTQQKELPTRSTHPRFEIKARWENANKQPPQTELEESPVAESSTSLSSVAIPPRMRKPWEITIQTVADIPPQPETQPEATAEQPSAQAIVPGTPKPLARKASPIVEDSDDEDYQVVPKSAKRARTRYVVDSDYEEEAPVAETTFAQLDRKTQQAYRKFVGLVEKGEVDDVEQALETHPGFLNQPDPKGIRPLSVAASVNREDMVRFFLNRKGIKPNAQDDAGYTAIMWPESPGKEKYLNTLQAFMDHLKANPGSIDLLKRDEKGMLARDHAFSNTHQDGFTQEQKIRLKGIIEEMRQAEIQQQQ